MVMLIKKNKQILYILQISKQFSDSLKIIILDRSSNQRIELYWVMPIKYSYIIYIQLEYIDSIISKNYYY